MSDEIDQIPSIPANASPVAPGTPDRKGHPFDQARHIPKMSKAGNWLPRSPGRGGKRKGLAAPSLSESASLFPEASSPSPSTPPPAPAEPAAAPSFDDIEKAAGPVAPAEAAPGAAPASAGDATLPAESSAEIGVRALYAVTGIAIGDHKAATAGPAEHKNLVAVATAYIRHRGWTAVGLVAVGGTLLAYLLQDGRREPLSDRLKKLFAMMRKKKPQNVTPIEDQPIDITPAVEAKPEPAAAPAAPVEKY